jgi:hypothetical protein
MGGHARIVYNHGSAVRFLRPGYRPADSAIFVREDQLMKNSW